MRVFDDAWRRDDLPRGGVVTIGNFDGLHLGQRALIERILSRARERRTSATVVSFEPHPMKVLRPESPPPCLTTPKQKLRLLEESGVDAVAIIRFDAAFSKTGASIFVEEFLAGRLGAVEVHVGSRFTFGRGREGSLELLIELGAPLGVSAHGVPEVLCDGEAISSTRVRALLSEGRVEDAARMLGRAYAVEGRVEAGEARGRGLGWPTANLAVENELFPLDGVYATEAWLEGEAAGRLSVSNVGTRPTFDGGNRRLIESHLLDFDGDLYGRPVELRFCSRLRAEKRFASPEELVRQIERDVRQAREYFAACAC